mmetsp:Transcript_11350/g.36067  ORF Transcript_11350/g.36067 Transcript_11350/m.36067 type:complete len:225 (+) Transcript_11350:409-1083(+)
MAGKSAESSDTRSFTSKRLSSTHSVSCSCGVTGASGAMAVMQARMVGASAPAGSSPLGGNTYSSLASGTTCQHASWSAGRPGRRTSSARRSAVRMGSALATRMSHTSSRASTVSGSQPGSRRRSFSRAMNDSDKVGWVSSVAGSSSSERASGVVEMAPIICRRDRRARGSGCCLSSVAKRTSRLPVSNRLTNVRPPLGGVTLATVSPRSVFFFRLLPLQIATLQ